MLMSGTTTPQPAKDVVAQWRAWVAAHPDDAQGWVSLGHALWTAGEQADALAALEQALVVDPANPDAHNNLGNAALELGDQEGALAHYRAAVEASPDHVKAYYNLGNACVATGRTTEAIEHFQRALTLDPEHAGAHNNLGNALRAEGRIDEALRSYATAIALRPNDVGSRNNLAHALLSLHRPHDALAVIDDALARDPNNPGTINNLGGALLALDRLEEAAETFGRVAETADEYPQAQFGRGLALLGLGRFAEGWAAYEARWRDPRFREGKADPPVPRWQGEPLNGRRILLHAEQGLGDTIQFSRYAPMVAARGGDVVLQVQPSLKVLLTSLAPMVLADTDAAPDVDLHCPLLSLPMVFGTDSTTIPSSVPYLAADVARVRRFGYLRPAPGRRRIGVAFSGSRSHTDDKIRSVPAEIFLPPLVAAGAMVHVVQTELYKADVETIMRLDNVDAHGPDLANFADTAALLSLMDLVISVDTSIAHLAGAMGLPTWVLLQHASDFRWLRNRTDSPWYPTMRLFRQKTAGDWVSVMREIVSALGEL
jgi:tetratricopeptide (TPR) repeat protein